MDRHRRDGTGNLPALDPTSENWRHLTSLLIPLHPDPQDLARRLLRRFGSLAALTAASDEAVRSSAEEGEAWPEAFLCIRRLMHDGMRERVLRSPLTEARAVIGRPPEAVLSLLDG